METESSKIKIIKWVSLAVAILVIIGLGSYLYLSEKTNYFEPSKTNQNSETNNEQANTNQTNEKESNQNATNTSTSQTSCQPTYSNDEIELLKTFATYTNKAYNLTFKYPSEWTKVYQEDKYILLKGEKGSVSLQITIADRAVLNTEEFKKVSSKNVTVACTPTTETCYQGYGLSEGSNKNVVEIKKNNIPFVIEIFYPNIGASLSSDYVELFDLILKTIEIK